MKHSDTTSGYLDRARDLPGSGGADQPVTICAHGHTGGLGRVQNVDDILGREPVPGLRPSMGSVGDAAGLRGGRGAGLRAHRAERLSAP